MTIEEIFPVAQAGMSMWWSLLLAFLLAVLGSVALYVHLERKRMRGDEPLLDDEGKRIRLPLTMQQTRALWALVIGTAAMLAIVGVFFSYGAENYYHDDAMRITIYMIALGGVPLYLIAHVLAGRKYPDAEPDERDIAVMHWAPTVQVLGMTFALATWAIGLTENYWTTGYVPIAYPNLIFLSTLLVGMLSRALGVLIGYRRF